MAKSPTIPQSCSDLDAFLDRKESRYPLKPDVQARIRWFGDQPPRPAEYALVYLHGFRASHPEGEPVHREIADFLGANLFLSRLQEHGLQTDHPLEHLTEKKLLDSARFALSVGTRIGQKVWLMGTSTGGALALYLAAQPALQEKIAGLILYSPLINFFGLKERLLRYSAVRNILRWIPGPSHQLKAAQPITYAEERIWDSTYSLQGALALGALVDHYMNPSLFRQIRCPVFTGYYYKNQQLQDRVVSVSAIRRMVQTLGTDPRLNHSANFPEAQSHVICSGLVSKSVSAVIQKTQFFLKSIGLHQHKAST